MLRVIRRSGPAKEFFFEKPVDIEGRKKTFSIKRKRASEHAQKGKSHPKKKLFETTLPGARRKQKPQTQRGRDSAPHLNSQSHSLVLSQYQSARGAFKARAFDQPPPPAWN